MLLLKHYYPTTCLLQQKNVKLFNQREYRASAQDVHKNV